MRIKYYLDDSAILGGCFFDPPNEGDAGYDICASREVYIWGNTDSNGSNSRVLVSTGLHVQIPDGYVGIIKDRSSMALKGIEISGGVIDSSYRGEIKVVMQNNHYAGVNIIPGDRIAQMIIVPHLSCDTEEVDSIDELDETERDIKGFGSTGK